MRLFFYNKSRAFKGYLRGKNTPDLDFYSKRIHTLPKARKLLSIAVDFYMIEYAIKIAFCICWMTYSFYVRYSSNFYPIKHPEMKLPDVSEQVLTNDYEGRLIITLFMPNDTTVKKAYWDYPLPNSSNERISIFSDFKLEEPRVEYLLYINEKVRMENVYRLVSDIQKSGSRKVYFGAKAENTLVTE